MFTEPRWCMECAGCVTLNWDIPHSAGMRSNRAGSWGGGSRAEFLVKDSALTEEKFPTASLGFHLDI